jgi:hypothetical protein
LDPTVACRSAELSNTTRSSSQSAKGSCSDLRARSIRIGPQPGEMLDQLKIKLEAQGLELMISCLWHNVVLRIYSINLQRAIIWSEKRLSTACWSCCKRTMTGSFGGPARGPTSPRIRSRGSIGLATASVTSAAKDCLNSYKLLPPSASATAGGNAVPIPARFLYIVFQPSRA